MPKTSVYCIVRSREQAEQIVDSLVMEDFDHADISLLMLDPKTGRTGGRAKSAKGEHRNERDEHSGPVRFPGLKRLAVPDYGICLTAGPVAVALAASAGAPKSRISGVLMAMGMSQQQARRFEDKLGEGDIMVGFHAEDSDKAAVAFAIFETELADHIATTAETGPEVPQSQRQDAPLS